MSPRRFWTSAEDTVLRALYPEVVTGDLAGAFARPVGSVYQRAQKLGLNKSEAYLASPAACRLRRGDNVGAAHRFQKGQVPANKGLRRPGWSPGRMATTQFRKGERNGVAVRLYKPIGSERVSKDGYLERKVNDGLPLQRRWRAVHLLTWEAAHGPLPAGHAVTFANGDRTDIRLENLVLVTRRELMLRNSVHNLPAPLPQTIQLLGALKRKINRRIRDEEQDRGPAQSPVRRDGSAGGPGQADGHRTRESDRGRGSSDRGLGEGRGAVPHRDESAAGDGLHRASRGRCGTAAAATGRRLVPRIDPRCSFCAASLTYKGRGRPPERCRPRCAKVAS